MDKRIHIYIYYDLSHDKIHHSGHRETICITREICVITDQSLVKQILSHQTTSINEFGELTNFNSDLIHQVLQIDHNRYKPVYEDINYAIKSVYYAKCEIVKQIDETIYSMLNKIND